MPGSLRQGRSGGSDYLEAVTEQGVLRWSTRTMPIKVFIASGQNVPGYRRSYRALLIDAFDEWATVSGNKLAWRLVASPYEADVICSFTPKLTGGGMRTEAGRTTTRTHIDPLSGHGIIDGARVQIQTLVNASGRPLSDPEMKRVCLHEVGHAYGLQGHSPYVNDIMFGAILPGQQPRLTDRDRKTMARLYASYPAFNDIAMRDLPGWSDAK